MKKSDLSKFKDEDLAAEILRRKIAQAEAEQAERTKVHDAVRKHIGALLEIVGEHGRTSCSDTNRVNEGRCTRCSLLVIKECDWIDQDLTFEFTIHRPRGSV